MNQLSDRPDDGLSRLDQATRQRLARLSGRPVDTTRLDGQLRAALAQAAPAPRLAVARRFWRPLAGLAAAAAVVLALSLALLNSGAPAFAAPADLVRLHQQAIAEMPAGMTVSSVADANRHLHNCCIREVQNRKLACVLLGEEQVPITMVVAHSRDFKPVAGQVVERDGRSYTLHSVDGVQMVMMQHEGRYVCLMGKVPAERLLAIAGELRF